MTQRRLYEVCSKEELHISSLKVVLVSKHDFEISFAKALLTLLCYGSRVDPCDK